MLEKALVLDSNFIATYRALEIIASSDINATYYRGKYIQKFLELIRIAPSKVPTIYYIFAGGGLLRDKRYEEAEAIFMKANELTRQQEPQVYNYLAMLYVERKRYAEAEVAAKKCIELAPLYLKVINIG
ncbi:MAG: hypothetical protein IPJ74_17640 [Saprospiraceae bacterium]|nr:hypothetical protein [Saprospiraceae bacterium]